MTRNGYTQTAAETIGTDLLKFSLLGFFAFYYVGFFARYAYRFGDRSTLTLLNLCRLQVDRRWIMHLLPLLSLGCVLTGFASALFTSSPAVTFIDAIPENFDFLGIPITSAIKTLCTLCAEIGIPIAIGTAGVIALLSELEAITARYVCVPRTLQTQAQFLSGLDQAMPLMRQLDAHGQFGHNFSLLKTVRTHKQAADYSPDTYAYYDLLDDVNDADSVGRRASGVYADPREDTRLTKMSTSRNTLYGKKYSAVPASEDEDEVQPVYSKPKSCNCTVM